MKKLISLFLVCAVCFSMCIIPASAGKVGIVYGSKASCVVDISDNLIAKRGKQYAKIKIISKYNKSLNPNKQSYDKCSTKVDILMTDLNGWNVIWSGTETIGRSGLTLKLGDDHPYYRIYISRHEETTGNEKNILQKVNRGAKDFKNIGDIWIVDSYQDCSLSYKQK